MPYDQRVIDAIFRRAGRISDPRKRNRYTRAALQTGIVESGLRNLDYGDADSLGWRQERASLYDDPMNLEASVDRFFREAAQLDRGQKSWELAADVQRPAAQYRGRYKDVARQAAGLLGDSPQPGSGSTPDASGAGPAAPDARTGFSLPPNSADFTSLLGSLLSRPEPIAPQAAPVAPPRFTPAPALPAGFTPLAPDPVSPAPAQDGVSQALSLLETLRGPDPTPSPSGQNQGSDRSIYEGVVQRRQERSVGGLPSLGREALSLAAELGFEGHSGQRTDEQNAAVGGAEDSDHLMRSGRSAFDIPMTGEKNLMRVGSSLARRFGVQQTKPGWWEGTIRAGNKRYRIQVIAGAQHDHGDHVHIGFRQLG